jgi:hypothetical protein
MGSLAGLTSAARRSWGSLGAGMLLWLATKTRDLPGSVGTARMSVCVTSCGQQGRHAGSGCCCCAGRVPAIGMVLYPEPHKSAP